MESRVIVEELEKSSVIRKSAYCSDIERVTSEWAVTRSESSPGLVHRLCVNLPAFVLWRNI